MAHALAPREYKSVLASFMSYRDGTVYPSNHVFSQEELAAVTADEIVTYFNYRSYGKVAPTLDDRPTHCRLASIAYWKKALSFFMPLKNHKWNELTKTGNPTKSQAILDMMARVKRFETRKQGAPSQARRPMKLAEIKAALHELRASDDLEAKYGLPALFCFQFHSIGRIDDTCKWYRSNLAPHGSHPGKAARFRLTWSKNVSDERDAPWQHLFGCMDWVLCTILHSG